MDEKNLPPVLKGARMLVRAGRRPAKRGRRPRSIEREEIEAAAVKKAKKRSRARRAIEKGTRKAQRKGRGR